MGRKNDSVNSIYCSNVWVLTAYIPLAGALVGNTRGERATFAFCWVFPCRECHKYFCCPWDMSTAADTQGGFQFSLCGLGQQLLGITPASIEGTVVAWCYSLSIFVAKVQESLFFFWKSWGTLISAPFSLPFKMLYLSINSRHAWTLLQSGGWKKHSRCFGKAWFLPWAVKAVAQKAKPVALTPHERESYLQAHTKVGSILLSFVPKKINL